LGGVEVGVEGGVEVGVEGGEDVVGVSLPLARAAFAGFDEDEGEAEGVVSACTGLDGAGVVVDGDAGEPPSSHSSSGALHPRFSITLMGSPFKRGWQHLSKNVVLCCFWQPQSKYREWYSS